MTGKLKKKFKEAEVFVSEKISPKVFEDSAFDLIISTLTIGHIKDIHLQFQEWDRILKTGGKILITDFHPDALAGIKRKAFAS